MNNRLEISHFISQFGWKIGSRIGKARNKDRFERWSRRIAVDATGRWRNHATIVPMRVVVRIPTGHLVAENVLVPRRLGTRLNRTQPPIAITRETINVLEGGGRDARGRGNHTFLSSSALHFLLFSPLLFTVFPFISRIFDYGQFFRPPFLLDFFLLLKKISSYRTRNFITRRDDILNFSTFFFFFLI